MASAFRKTSSVLGNLIEAMATMTAVHTKDFLKLHDMQVDIERGMANVLEEIRRENEIQDNLKKTLLEVQSAQSKAKLFEAFETERSVTRWVIIRKDTHGTLCNAPGCHSNCHVPCELEKTIDKNKFKDCQGRPSSSSLRQTWTWSTGT